MTPLEPAAPQLLASEPAPAPFTPAREMAWQQLLGHHRRPHLAAQPEHH